MWIRTRTKSDPPGPQSVNFINIVPRCVNPEGFNYMESPEFETLSIAISKFNTRLSNAPLKGNWSIEPFQFFNIYCTPGIMNLQEWAGYLISFFLLFLISNFWRHQGCISKLQVIFSSGALVFTDFWCFMSKCVGFFPRLKVIKPHVFLRKVFFYTFDIKKAIFFHTQLFYD